MITKICIKCDTEKPLNDFHRHASCVHGRRNDCKVCVGRHIKIYDKVRYLRHKDDILVRNKQWRDANPTYNAQYIKFRLETDVQYKLAHCLRGRLRKALAGNFKSGSAVRDLGCSVDFLKKYLEAQFRSGMSWGNYGEWHIDHIKPLASFDLTNREELLKACHYTNLQPLWKHENLSKGNRQ